MDQLTTKTENVKLSDPNHTSLLSTYFGEFVFAGVALTAFGIGFLIWNTEHLRYDIAIKRINFEREQVNEQQQTERLRIEKATSLAAIKITSPQLEQITDGATGLYLLRGLIVKGTSATARGASQNDKRATSAVLGMMDVLVSAGAIAANEAKSLKDELQKAGVEIGVDAAKAIIDRYIKAHDNQVAGGENKSAQTFQGTTQVNTYCNAPPVRMPPPTPPRPPTPKPHCQCTK